LKTYFQVIFTALLLLLSINGCFSQPSETVISSASFTINSEGVDFKLDPPLKRRYNSGSVQLELIRDWQPVPPWTSIQLDDGRLAKVEVVLFAADGKTFKATIIGWTSGMLNARFEPEIPKKASITKVKITADVPLKCKRVVWSDYNAK
jgi:hypothetical protein